MGGEDGWKGLEPVEGFDPDRDLPLLEDIGRAMVRVRLAEWHGARLWRVVELVAREADATGAYVPSPVREALGLGVARP